MTKNLDDVLNTRPVNRKKVDRHKQRMIAATRAWQLRELRQQTELSQVEIAVRLGVSQNRISRLEQGDLERTQIDTLRRYVEALGGEMRVEVSLDGDVFLIA
jgi:predicted XRE-type DNA-binding protein